ncbi:MAG TPA: hypothetical protein VK081_07795, partial [Planctomycetota bacterium]|nr:hypothetical protein [Planctomycetota bacterium]
PGGGVPVGGLREILRTADIPSAALRDAGIIDEIPELAALAETEQDPGWHPEGDVLVHSLWAADLAAEHAAEKGCTNLRTATYLAWRYARCPSGCYESWEARRAGRLVGFAVLRPVHDLLPQSCTIAELLTRSGDGEALDALVACATARARAHGRRRILAVFPPQAREAGALHDRGFESEPSARTFFRSIGCRLAQPGLTFSEVGQRWWYTLGDFDLV